MDKFNIFGRSYESVGKESADFCIKTKGKVKIKWGNKYIDLIKDGKLNVEADFLFSVPDEDHIGSKDGIYITDDGVIYIKIGDVIVPIYGDTEGSDFVAYVIQNGKTGDEKTVAQRNIGLNFNTLAEAQSSGVKNGMVYISDESSIYKIKDGVFEKLEFKVPNPFTEPIVIKIANGQYSLLIDGYFSTSNSQLVIGAIDNGIRIYAEDSDKYIDVSDVLNICIDKEPVIVVENTRTTVKNDLIIDYDHGLISETVKSHEDSEASGYLLTMEDGESWLYVDNLVVRKRIDTSIHMNFEDFVELADAGKLVVGTTYTIDDFQNEWDMVEERKEDVPVYRDDDEDSILIDYKYKNVFPLQVVAITEYTISQNAKFFDYPEWTLTYDFNYRDDLYVVIDEGNPKTVTAKGRIIYLRDEYGNEADYDFKHLRFLVDGVLQFTFNGDEIQSTKVFKDGSLNGGVRNNIIRCDSINVERRSVPTEEGLVNYVLGKSGNIIQVKKKISNNSFGYITGSLTVNTEICQGNNIDVKEIKKLILDGEMSSNTMRGDLIETLTVSKKMAYTDIVFDKINLTDFPGAEKCIIKNGLENCKFADVLKSTTIHSRLSGFDFDATQYPYLYNDKVVDVYINENELRYICMPDTVFPGMIVMYDGRKPIPTGWALCDGTNGTLNLLDKFVKFASTAGNAGGSNDGMIKISNLPNQTIETNETGNHSHTYTYPIQGWSDNANDRHVMEKSASGQTGTAGNHKHQFQLNTGIQERFEPPYNTVIPIMYTGG